MPVRNIFLSVLLVLLSISCGKPAQEPTIKQHLVVDLYNLIREVQSFRKNIVANSNHKTVLAQFRTSRLAYKKVEWAVEYFVPETARFINGPALDEMELEENKFFPPAGFQVIEEIIFPAYDNKNKSELIRETDILISNLKQTQIHLEAISITDDYVADAIQQQLFRITTLGITGFDSPILQASIPETKQSLAALADVIERLQNTKALKVGIILAERLKKAQHYCEDHNDFNSFDRAAFISGFLNPIAGDFHTFQKGRAIPTVPRNRVVRASASTLFDKNAFDPDAFVMSEDYKFSAAKADLGKRLFYDNRFSRNDNRSCATCHQPEKAFTDGLKTNFSLIGKKLSRNTPTLTYASLQNAQFWDMRQLDLEKQSVDVIESRDEMHGTMADIHKKIAADKRYENLFRKAFPKAKQIEIWQIQNAIASYVRSLNAFDSRFDRYMRGDAKAMTAKEISGMNLFMGRAKCATCHFAPLFNGTVPPMYTKTEHEVIGTPDNLSESEISADPGRFYFNQLPQLKGAFKTPTLRNIAVTAPYMHNGVYATLEQVVEFYNKGGGVGLGLPVDNQTLPTDQLNLTASEKKALVAFMKTLTDKAFDESYTTTK